mgnify:CR=1 FL=1
MPPAPSHYLWQLHFHKGILMTSEAVQEVVSRHDARHAEASKVAEFSSPRWHAEFALLTLRDHAADLPACYPSFAESLWDFYADLPWKPGPRDEAIKLMMADSRFGEIVDAVQAAHGYDMRVDLEKALSGAED